MSDQQNNPVESLCWEDLSTTHVYRFLGVKMIPPGVHFVHWNAVNTVHSQVGPRAGFFHDFAAGECVVKRYVVDVKS